MLSIQEQGAHGPSRSGLGSWLLGTCVWTQSPRQTSLFWGRGRSYTPGNRLPFLRLSRP